ncbi:MAG: exopolysaccharide biosynthesis protein [Pseudomonadota bacterium]
MLVNSPEPPEAISENKRKRRSFRSFSRILESLVSGDHEVSTVGDITKLIANRSLSSLLAFFAALNLIPLPPGTSVILGIPIVIIAAQLMFLQKRIWMPKFISERAVKPETLDNLVTRILPWTLKIEKFLKPRYWPFKRYQGDQIVGIITFILGIVVVFPIPLGNAPPAFAIFVIGLANSQKDGLWLTFGIVAGILSIMLAAGILVGGFVAVDHLLGS